MKPCWGLIAALLPALPVSAEAPPATSPPVFSVHDLDRDGALDRAEFERLRAECRAKRAGPGRRPCPLEFASVDADGDGRIDEQEVLDALSRKPARAGRHGGQGGRLVF